MLNLLLSRYHQIKGDSSAGEAHPKREGTEYGHCEPLIFPHLPSPPVAKIISTALTVHKDEDWAQAATRLLTIAGIETNQVEVRKQASFSKIFRWQSSNGHAPSKVEVAGTFSSDVA